MAAFLAPGGGILPLPAPPQYSEFPLSSDLADELDYIQ
jgi:hypothetical protein